MDRRLATVILITLKVELLAFNRLAFYYELLNSHEKYSHFSFFFYISGVSLAGAGGGGFMCMITKEENAVSIIRDEIEKLKVNGFCIIIFRKKFYTCLQHLFYLFVIIFIFQVKFLDI